MRRKYTFVTVCHQVDYEALCLQARSMVRYLPDNLVHEIIVIDNGLTAPGEHLLTQYGHHRPHVRIIPATEIAPAEAFKRTGWWSQQVLKLMVCNHVQTAHYVALDAKNTMVYPLRRSYLETIWGWTRSYHVDYTEHGSRRWLVNTLRYFNLDDSHIKKFMPITTPYTFINKYVRELIPYVEKRDKKPFPEAMYDHNLTEFFLYAGYLIHTKQSPYHFSQIPCHVIFDTTVKFAKEWVEATKRDQRPFFSVHRAAKLSPDARRIVDDFYWERGVGSYVRP